MQPHRNVNIAANKKQPRLNAPPKTPTEPAAHRLLLTESQRRRHERRAPRREAFRQRQRAARDAAPAASIAGASSTHDTATATGTAATASATATSATTFTVASGNGAIDQGTSGQRLDAQIQADELGLGTAAWSERTLRGQQDSVAEESTTISAAIHLESEASDSDEDFYS